MSEISPQTAARGIPVPELPHSCACGVRWSGYATCHCGSCHYTFSSLTGFDLHRRGGACREPWKAGLQLDATRAFPCWGHPPPATPFTRG